LSLGGCRSLVLLSLSLPPSAGGGHGDRDCAFVLSLRGFVSYDSEEEEEEEARARARARGGEARERARESQW
jgi:hypothetical protein